MKTVNKLLLLLVTSVTLSAQNLAVIYEYDGDIKERYDTFVDKDLKEIGFFLNDPHKNVHKVYEAAYGSTALDNLAFGSIVNESVVRPLFNKDPRLTGFNPFNLLTYKSQDNNHSYITHLTPEAILEMLEIDDAEIKEKFTATFAPLDKLIEERLGGKKSFIEQKGVAKDKMMNFEIPFEEPEDLDEFLEEFQEKFETAFVDKKYIIAGFYNFKESFNSEHDDLPSFESFWSYALCNLDFSYAIFDKKGGLPLSGIFAPCSMYVYVKEGENKLVIGMPTMENWSATLGITDAKKLEWVKKLDVEIPEIIRSLGGKDMPNGNPLAKTLSKTVTKAESQDLSKVLTLLTQLNKRVENLEKLLMTQKAMIVATPPKTSAKEMTTKTTVLASTLAARVVKKASKSGTVNHRELPTFLRAPYASVEQISADLTAAGFKVLAQTPINKKGDLTTITFTCPTLQKMAGQKNRGFLGVLSATVDDKAQKVSITNPLYFTKAYMQEVFDESAAQKILFKLNASFENLKSSHDGVEARKLGQFQYMMGMPTYADSVIVGEGENLLDKAQKSGKVAFSVKLESGASLLGLTLSKHTGKFIKTIGRHNAALVPYLVLIENNKAKILAPKYQIALYYPKLSMGEFGAIATAPGAIIKEFERLFK